jgi:glycosyltransferase involved in cell wall biosynthesis
MLKIALILGDIYPWNLGGAEIHVVEVMKRLAERGCEIHAFVGECGEIKRILPSENIIIHQISYPKIKNLRGFIYTVYATREISKYLKHNHFDIIHAKQETPQGTIGVLLSKRFHIPLYVTVQNPLAYIEERVLVTPFKLDKKILGKIQSIQKPVTEFVLSHSNIVAAVSNYSLSHCKEMGAMNCVLIPNGVDTNIFRFDASRQRKNGRDSIHIVSTSSLIPRNGLGTLITAFGLLSKKLPNATLTIAGKGILEKELKTLAANISVSDKVTFMGSISHDKVPGLLHSADLFVRPSIAEGFGVSFIEAMSCGIPVVACPTGGIVDFVKNGETGILVPPNNPNVLCDAMYNLLSDQHLYSKIQKNSLELVKEKYSWDNIAAKVLASYNLLLKNNGDVQSRGKSLVN